MDKQNLPIETIAIVIGVSSYLQEDLLSLPAAKMDAVNFARAIRNWGIPEDHILLFLNQEVDKDKLDVVFELLAKKKEKHKLIFYFCGHGHRTIEEIPKSYLIFHDSHCKSEACVRAFNLDCFFEKIAKMNTLESYIFIDACQSRINHFVHPKLAEEIRGKPIRTKVYFVCFPRGLRPLLRVSMSALGILPELFLKSLSHLRFAEGSLTQFLCQIQNEMEVEHLPPPEMINFGSQKISLISSQDSWRDDEGRLSIEPN